MTNQELDLLNRQVMALERIAAALEDLGKLARRKKRKLPLSKVKL